MGSFWSGWIIVLTVITFVGMTWLLFSNRKRGTSGDEVTTGHSADGIEEYDNPLPAWWFWMFAITIIWGAGYLIIYPGLGGFSGLLGWTQLGQYEAEVAAADEKYRDMRDRYLAMPIEKVAADPAARKMGQRMFGNNCAQCHGSDGKGAYGFPNLTDSDWLWGGSTDQIKHSINAGRNAVMPPWGPQLGEDGVAATTAYILSLSGRSADQALIDAGKQQYGTFCVACHGPDAKGNAMLGAPDLTNGIWLYGGDEAAVAHSIRSGRNGIMPAFAEQIGEDKIHIIAAYVYSLSQD